ncbi:MAG: cobalt transporter, partial [Mesorhizobium sp.]
SEFAGGIGSWRQGVFWGLAGFAVFTLAPGLGLPPELPAMPAAELLPRQIWWISTVAATAVGLGLIAFRKSLPLAILAVVLIVAPHVVGAPQPVSFETAIPEGLHHQFVVAVTLTDLVFWLVLGAAVGVVRGRFTGTSTSLRDSFA